MSQVKYIIAKGKEKGREVKLGDTLYRTLMFGEIPLGQEPYEATAELLDQLIKEGEVEVVYPKEYIQLELGPCGSISLNLNLSDNLEYEPNQEVVSRNIGKKLPIYLDDIYRMPSEYYLATRQHGSSLKDLRAMIQLLYTINPAAARVFVLYAAAVELDKQYEGHIRDAANLYFIDDSTNKIIRAADEFYEYDRSKISFQNTPWFRTKSDAVVAKKMWLAIEKDVQTSNYID